MQPLEVDTPTIDALVPLVPELVIFATVAGMFAWLAWAILGVLDRHLERLDGRRPGRDQLLDAMREIVVRHDLDRNVDELPPDPLPSDVQGKEPNGS